LPPDEDEDIETIRVTREEAMAMIADGTICDSKTALGILLARDCLQGQTIRLTAR
jgi:sulfopyruvate decarboxylase TPP-binding subunit